jgi:hypothetical protein
MEMIAGSHLYLSFSNLYHSIHHTFNYYLSVASANTKIIKSIHIVKQSKYFIANVLAWNPGKIIVIKLIQSNSPQYLISIEYNDEHIKESKDTKFFGLKIDNHLHWINYIDQLCYMPATLTLRNQLILLL